MTRLEFLQRLKQIVKIIDEFYVELKAKFPNCENNLEKQSFIYYSQTIKADCMAKIDQYSRMSDDEFARTASIVNFHIKQIETSYKAIDLDFKTLMTSTSNNYTPSNPSKTFPLM